MTYQTMKVSEARELSPFKKEVLSVEEPNTFREYFDGTPHVCHTSNTRVVYQLNEINLILPIRELISEHKEDIYTIKKVTLGEDMIVVHVVSDTYRRKHQYIYTSEAHISLDTFSVIHFECIDKDDYYTW